MCWVFPREDLGPSHKRRKQSLQHKSRQDLGTQWGDLKYKGQMNWGLGRLPSAAEKEKKRRGSCFSGWLYYWQLASCSLRTLGSCHCQCQVGQEVMRPGPTVQKPTGGGDGGTLKKRHQFSSLPSYLSLSSPPPPPISTHGIIILIKN